MELWEKDYSNVDTNLGIDLIHIDILLWSGTQENSMIPDLLTKGQTPTTKKNNDLTKSKLNFPQKRHTGTWIISNTSDDFNKNGERICAIKRKSLDQWTNSDNPILLQL